MMTAYHAKYYAHELTKRCSADSLEKLAGALVDAQVDINPHQVEAALFAFQSPLSRGALLADEVGLGKTIEAGLVISQKWAERKRRILVITPANLRKQWHQELQEKFFLSCRILEARSYNEAVRWGNVRPFECAEIVICSYQFATSKAAEVSLIPWDLVVIDEAHRLRNVYKPANVIANTLKQALNRAPKILLTATPMQNTLLELYGLVSFIDARVFGDISSFREQYGALSEAGFAHLKARLRPLCIRTLRRQVLPYVRYTRRWPLVQEFTPEESEDRLYHLVSGYLQRDNLQALPSSQRTLMTLVLRKLLASSTFAIAGALDTLVRRLRARLAAAQPETTLEEELDQDYEALGETADEWDEDEAPPEPMTAEERNALTHEIADLERFRELAVSITHNAKGQALLTALHIAFTKARELGAAQKAIIFTESRKTQNYLQRVLADSPWNDGIVLFNGANNDEKSKLIYSEWLERHKGTDRVTGSRTADMRSALVDYFRERGSLMIATEAAAEGINLQFCSLVVNYDLPWNPQRIEQRIGRCHRYGQKHDVVVVNFLNRTNEADQRVFQLLSEKFQLFEGVFGASDEVLGAIESGVDFEKRINTIYQHCRRPEETQTAFDLLQQELSAQISDAMTHTRQLLLENFDAAVHDKLRLSDASSRAYLNRYEQLLMELTRFELAETAEFTDNGRFQLKHSPLPDKAPVGLYELPKRSGEAHLYRLGHPLAEWVIGQARGRALPLAEVSFDYNAYGKKVSILEPLIGRAGSLSISMLTVEALAQVEDTLILAGITDEGDVLDEEQVRRMLALPGKVGRELPAIDQDGQLQTLTEQRKVETLQAISRRNAAFFEAETEKLDAWADDLKMGLERDIKDLDRQIKEGRRAASAAMTLEDKLLCQRQQKELEGRRNKKRRELFDEQDRIDAQRDQLIARLEQGLNQQVAVEPVFLMRWIMR